MARLESLNEPMRSLLAGLECPEYPNTPGLSGPPLAERKVAIVSTAGLHLRGDRPFVGVDGSYRVIPSHPKQQDLGITHMSVNWDRSGFQQDFNLAIPIDRLHELAAAGLIGSVAQNHYTLMGAADPRMMEASAKEIARQMKAEGVTAALLVPI